LEAREVPAIIVNNPVDIVLPGLTNLRQAIDQANAAPGADTIQFAAALHFMGGGTAPSPVYDTLPTITDDLTIDGTSGVAGQRATVTPAPVPVAGEPGEPVNPPQFRLFKIAAPAAVRINVEFKALTISGGNASNPADPNGGAIAMFNSNVILDNCFVTGNRANGEGGGLYSTGNPSKLTLTKGTVVANNTAGGNGGGIAVTNTSLRLEEGTQVTGNTAGLGGGGIAAFADNYVGIVLVKFVELDGTGAGGPVVVNSNTANSGDGGGVLVKELNAGAAVPDVNFLHTNVTGNTAVGAAPAPGGAWTSGRGGGVAALGGLVVDSDNATNVTGNKQSAPAPTTAPFKLGVYLAPAVFGLFAGTANVEDNEQLP
jgi:predicted outer membrane repeat protein